MDRQGEGVHEYPHGESVERFVAGREAEKAGPLQAKRDPGYDHPDGYPEGQLSEDLAEFRFFLAHQRQQYHHERQGEAVVDPALHVQQMTEPPRNFFPADDCRGEDRVRGAQDRPNQERLGPGKPRDVVADQGGKYERQRQAQGERAPRQPPGVQEVPHPHPHPIREQHAEQRKLRQTADHRVSRFQVQDACGTGDETNQQEENSRREHRTLGETRE